MKKKGISLIVLIITIVVIIILAAAIIVNIANTNLIENASAAVFKSDVSAMQDELTMYISDEFINEQGKYDSKKLQATEEGIWYGSNQQEGTITDIIKSMDEKYVGKLFIQDGKLVANKMAITVEEEKWLNDLGIMSTTKTDIGILNITPSTKDWTNVNVELEINYTQEIPAGYAIEYKVNAGNWQEGTRVVVEKNNTIVTARLYSKEKDNEALTNSYEVSKIDKEVPDITNMKITITAGTNNVTAIASGAIDELSGLDKYQYSIDGTTWQDSGVFSGYKNATEVTVYAKAIDKVGNESESISNTGTTTSISSPTLNLVNDEWTKDDVIASVTGTVPEGYVLEYKLSGGMTKDWTTYTGNVTINVNNTTMVARYYNEVIDDEIATPSKTASRIDKFAPDIIAMKVTLTATENTITAVASGATDSLSGEIKYKYSSDGTVWQDSGTFSGIKSGTETTVYAKAIDKVGNESASVSNKGTTTAISGTVTIAQNPAAGTWTNGNVTVTLSYANIPTGYVMQYKLGTGNWTTYSSALTVSENNTVVTARLYNSSVNDEVSVSSKTIANIDKVVPTTPTSVSITVGTNSVTATATGSSDTLSGLSKYQYSLNNSTWQDSGTFSGIKSGTATTVYARAVDKVGNVSGSISNKGTTTAISGNVSIAQNPAATKSDGSVNWTKGNVSVTLSYSNIPSGYVIQYSLSGGMALGWTAYSSAISVTANNTTVKARLYNATAADEVAVNSKVISNIDKAAPVTTNMKLTLSSTSNSVTAVASGSTDDKGTVTYEYSLDNVTWQTSGEFKNLEEFKEYTVYARAIDKAGNKSDVLSNKVTTEELMLVVFDNTKGSANTTINGGKFAYDNPVVPVGFKAVTTAEAAWSDEDNNGKIDGWNNGLVIQDENKNQFVWVPCTTNGANGTIQYTKNFNYPNSYDATSENTSDDAEALPSVNGTTLDETDQISTYGGFYIGRYEAGVPGKTGTPSNSTGKPTVQQGATVWTNIDYTNSNASAKLLVNTDNVKSGLVTGTQWDTAMKWIENAGISVTDSTSWGNYYDDPVDGNNGKHTAGFKEEWKAKNIYDLAGNTWEWTGEIYSTIRIYRGGSYYDYGSNGPASFRNFSGPSFTSDDWSFRLSLYVM